MLLGLVSVFIVVFGGYTNLFVVDVSLHGIIMLRRLDSTTSNCTIKYYDCERCVHERIAPFFYRDIHTFRWLST